jgi:hypothetical protein
MTPHPLTAAIQTIVISVQISKSAHNVAKTMAIAPDAKLTST